MMIEHVDAIVDMRRHLTLERGETPNKGAEVLENLIATDNPGGFAPGGRLNWAADLDLPLMKDKGQAEVLFWVGDGAFDDAGFRCRAVIAFVFGRTIAVKLQVLDQMLSRG